jgi:Mrp family chromosome partitioning ATPase
MPGTLLDRLGARRLLVVTGKGGVGKTVVAGSLGRLLASPRRKVLVVEVDPRENLHQMLGIRPSGGDLVEAGGNLHVQNLKPRQVVDELVRERLKLAIVARRVVESPVYQHFVEGAPGLAEVAILGHALRALRLARGIGVERGGAFDLVVLDAPASGHGASLLAAPLLLAAVIRQGPLGGLGRQLAEFVADPARSGVVVVTAAEAMPVDEALELRATLAERLDREPELLVINGLYPPAPPPAAAEVGRSDPALELWRRRRRLNEAELARLAAAWRGPRVELPLLPIDRGPELIAALAGRLGAGLAAGGAAGAAPPGEGGPWS